MQQNILKASIVLSVLFSVLMVACSRQVDVDIHSPAHYIQMSEKLQIPAPVNLPSDLPKGNARVITLFAEGVQKYKAQLKAGSAPATYEWVFVAPQADLFDATNKKVGVHSAGPIWQLSENGDFIQAQQFAPPRAVASPDPGSIDWLLLMPKTGTTSTGIFANVAYIQRIATIGGKAPIDVPTSEAQTIDVKYKAVYRFSKKN